MNLESLERLAKEYPEAAAAAREARLTEAMLLLEREIKRLTPEGAGPIHLRDTVFSKINNLGVGAVGIVATPAVYGAPLEYGTKPHFPPIAPIQFWVEKRLGLSGKDAQSAAYCIARAISRRGTKGYLMFNKAFDANEDAVIRILEQIPADIIKAVSV